MHCSESLGTVDFRLYPNFGKPHQVVAGINMTTTATKTTSRYVYVCTRKLVGETRTFSWIAAALDYFGNYTLCAHACATLFERDPIKVQTAATSQASVTPLIFKFQISPLLLCTVTTDGLFSLLWTIRNVCQVLPVIICA